MGGAIRPSRFFAAQHLHAGAFPFPRAAPPRKAPGRNTENKAVPEPAQPCFAKKEQKEKISVNRPVFYVVQGLAGSDVRLAAKALQLAHEVVRADEAGHIAALKGIAQPTVVGNILLKGVAVAAQQTRFSVLPAGVTTRSLPTNAAWESSRVVVLPAKIQGITTRTTPQVTLSWPRGNQISSSKGRPSRS